jgi:hypothetical protein
MPRNVHAQVLSCRGTFMQRYIHTEARSCKGTFMHIYIHAHIRSYTCTIMHRYVHTQVPPCLSIEFLAFKIYQNLVSGLADFLAFFRLAVSGQALGEN